MTDKVAVFTEEQKDIIFKQDTKRLGKCTEDFIQSFYPAYNTSLNSIKDAEEKQPHTCLNKNFTFYRLSECTIDNIDDIFSFFQQKMQKLFMTAYSIEKKLCYGIVSNKGKTSLVIGIYKQTDSLDDTTIKQIMEGLLPGMKIEEYQIKFGNGQQLDNSKEENKQYGRYVGYISGVPTLKGKETLQKNDLSSLMRSLNGKNYTIMIWCKPVKSDEIQDKIATAIDIQDKCFSISKRTTSLQYGSSDSNTHTDMHNESNSTQESKTKGVNVSGTLPGVAAGTIIGSAIPGVGTAIGAIGGGIIGAVVGRQFGLNKSDTKGESHVDTDGYSEAITKTISSNESISGEVQNGFALELMKMAETMSNRLKIGRSIGMWESFVTYSSDNKTVSDIIQGSLYSEMASEEPEILPPIVFSYMDEGNKDNKNAQQIIIPRDFLQDSGNNSLCSLMTSKELCGICSIPVDNTVGFEIKKAKGYSINNHSDATDISIGNVCEYERPLLNASFGLSENDLNKHTFVCGITGSGKTNTIKRILSSIEKPFMVIEPAKKEYRNLKQIKKENVYTLGRPEINCIKLNPFYIMKGISPQQHIDLLKDLFCASFALYGPMPYILEKCLYNIYTKKGWDLTLGFHPYLVGDNSTTLFKEDEVNKKYEMKAHPYLFPTMQDLKDEIDYYIENEMTYEGDVKGNIRSAMKARIDSLCVGAKGYMFNTYETINFETLFKESVVLELEGLADDADKSFSLGLLIIYVNEFRQIQKELNQVNGLAHILVIEEAHRLLKNVSSEANEDIGNPQGKAVEHFTNMLAEMRSYGQGVIVAEQIPTKLAPDVIKNSSNKIVHRVVALDDQKTIANTIGVDDQNAIYFGNQRPGYALCHKEGMVQPVIVKVFEKEEDDVKKDEILYENDINNKLEKICKSIISNQLSKDVSVWAVKILISLMYSKEYEKISNGLELALNDLDKKRKLKSITIIRQVEKDTYIKESIVEEIISLLISGVFSNHKMPDNKIVESMKKTINDPREQNINDLKEKLIQFYGKDKLEEKVIDIVAALVSKEYSGGYSIEKLVEDFMLYKDNAFIQAVKEKLQKEMNA